MAKTTSNFDAEDLHRIVNDALTSALKANATTDPRVDSLEKLVRQLAELVSGNGHPENGLVLKVDRLVNAEEKRSQRNWQVILLVLGNLISLAFNLLGK